MEYTGYLDFILIVLFFLTTAGMVSAILAFIVFREKSAEEGIKTELTAGAKSRSRVSSKNSLTRAELEELLFALEREKRTITLGFNTMTSTHREVAKSRVERIETKLQHVRTQLAEAV